MQIENEFRPLASDEKALIERMLDEPFPGSNQLRSQLGFAIGRRVDQEGSLALSVSGGAPAAVVRTVPTEAWCQDADGTMIRVLLHVRNGLMVELEIYKDDGSPILRRPTARSIELPPPGPG